MNGVAKSRDLEVAKIGKHFFVNADELLDFVTKRWQELWVTCDIWDENVLEIMLRRPFFLLVSVDAPVSLRWKRYKGRSVMLRSHVK